ncbi:TetR-like C-terminal domain-containing protein [Amycolatopsis mediterranei]|nr:TetR-like C-terminal domain-containing protein [Amycolatopsis mediterranei]
MRFVQDHPDLFATMFRSRPDAGPVGHDSFEVLREAVADAQSKAILSAKPSVEQLATAIWATLHGLAVLSLRRPHERFRMGEAPEDLATTALSALLGL